MAMRATADSLARTDRRDIQPDGAPILIPGLQPGADSSRCSVCRWNWRCRRPVSIREAAARFWPGSRLRRPRLMCNRTRGPLIKLHGSAGVSNLADNIAERMQNAQSPGSPPEGLECEIELVRWPGPGQGAAISLIAEHEDTVPATFVGLGERGKPSEAVADEAVDQLLAFEADCRRGRRPSLSRSDPAASGLRARPQRIHRLGSDRAPPHERAHDPSVSGSLDHGRGRPGREPAGESGHQLGPTRLSAVFFRRAHDSPCQMRALT